MSAADQSRKFRYVLTKGHVSVSKKRHESVDFRRQAGADTGLVTFFLFAIRMRSVFGLSCNRLRIRGSAFVPYFNPMFNLCAHAAKTLHFVDLCRHSKASKLVYYLTSILVWL